MDIAVIETGLGGRLDATNVLSPLVTLTTDISLDHVEILGNSLEKLAYEKGGIIKEGIPHLVGLLKRSPKAVIRAIARERGADFFQLRPDEFDFKNSCLNYHSDSLKLNRLKPGMPGKHQLANAALALKAIELLKRQCDLNINQRDIRSGLAQSTWPGRFQIIKKPGKPTLILDVCHNIGSVNAFVDTFRSEFPGGKTRIITGFVKRKPHQAMFDKLSKVAASYALVPLKTKRSEDMRQLSEDINWNGIDHYLFGSLKAASNKLLKNATQDDIFSIIGSHFLVGEFLDINGWS